MPHRQFLRPQRNRDAAYFVPRSYPVGETQHETVVMFLDFLNTLASLISFVVLSTAAVEFLSRMISRIYLGGYPGPLAHDHPTI